VEGRGEGREGVLRGRVTEQRRENVQVTQVTAGDDHAASLSGTSAHQSDGGDCVFDEFHFAP